MVLPKGIVSSGFPRARETCRRIGIEFDPWQTDLNRCVLAKTADGLFAADTVVLSIARQVGKTFDIGALVFAECIAEPGTTVIWTAHRFKVSRETFNELRALAKSPKLTPHIDYDAITTAAGNECIPFRNGSRIVFAARERGAIRGFSKVKMLILDEAQILTDAALSDLAPTMNQAVNPQIILMGTPPKPTDPSEVFTGLRKAALDGESEGVLYVEISADLGCDPDDRESWRQANPSYPKRTPARAILRLRKLLSLADFLREALGIWDPLAGVSVLDAARWRELEDERGMSSVTAFGIEVSMDLSAACIASAGPVESGTYVEVVTDRGGMDWVVDEAVRLNETWQPAGFVVDEGGPAASLVDDLEAAGLFVLTTKTADIAAASAWMVNAVNEGTVWHGPQPELADAVAGARKRKIRDGGFAFGRVASDGVDIRQLVAVTLAAHGHVQLGAVDAAAYII